MNIITATSWNGTSFTWNVEHSRWDLTDNVNIGQQHVADGDDLAIAKEQALLDAAPTICDTAEVVKYEDLLDQ